MKKILVSGLVNMETTVKVGQFPIPYFPIDYPFFGVETAVSGVGYNIARAVQALGDRVTLLGMTGTDFPGAYIRQAMEEAGLDTAGIRPCLRETPSSAVLYGEDGRRQVYCDLKDIQETAYEFPPDVCRGVDLAAVCNINFSRPLLKLAKEAGVPIATDVHVLSDIYSGYDREFMEAADLLFLSDEAIGEDYRDFLRELARVYRNSILVLGRGSRGAAMYVRREDRVYELPAVNAGPVVNTVGAGDALFSGFVHFYSTGMDPLDCLIRAQWFAAAKIRSSGAARGFMTEAGLDALMGR